MKDFSRKPRVVEFTVNGDVFRGKPFLAAQTMIDFTVSLESVKASDSAAEFEAMLDSLRLVLMPDSFQRFRERMRDPSDASRNGAPVPQDGVAPPIEIDQVNEIIEWITGEYGMRPTQPSSESSGGSPSLESGTNSTASTLDGASISVTSPSTVS